MRVRSLNALAPDLWPHQREGIEWIRPLSRALLGDEMALGKSRVLLQALDLMSRTIITCPASVVPTWRAQAQRWRPDLRATSRARLRRPREGEILILSDDGLPLPIGGRLTIEPLSDVTVLVDEVHRCKEADALRTQSVRALVRQCGRAWGATGTPMLGSPPDLWGALSTLGLAGSFGGYEAFVAMFEGKRERGRNYTWGEVSPLVREHLQRVMLRRFRADVLPDLPREQAIDVPVSVPRDLLGYFDSALRAYAPDEGSKPPNPEAMRALANAKVPAALELLESAAAQMQVLVFSAHREPVLAVGQLAQAGAFVGDTPAAERARLVRDFADGRLRILAMTIDTGGVGIDGLQVAGGVLFIDEDYTPGLNDQAVGRAIRPGQTHDSVIVWRLVSDHPLERRFRELVLGKARVIGASVGR